MRSLVQLLLYQQGEKLFETAAPLPEGRHQISALLLGCGCGVYAVLSRIPGGRRWLV